MSYTNPFQNVPSASKIHRVMACPASHQAELAASDVIEDTGDASHGHDVHAVLADEVSTDEVSYSAAQTAEMCAEQAERLLAEWQDADSVPISLSELRYGLTDIGAVVTVNEDTKATILFTGQFDHLYIQGDRGLLIDFKALHGEHQPAIKNTQLMSLAVLVTKKHGLESVRVALVQPWKGKPTVVDYNFDGLVKAEMLLSQVLDVERNASPKDREAGDHCKYCKARFACPTLKNRVINDLDVIRPETISGDAKHQASVIFARMAESSIPQLIHIHENVRSVMTVFLASHAAVFKQAIENNEVYGYSLKEKSGRRKVSDVAKAYERAAAHGVTAEAFTGKCSISLKGLNEALKDATKAKGKVLESLADEVLHGITDMGKPSFEIVKNNQIES